MHYPEKLRHQQLAIDLFGDPNWRASAEIKQVINYYTEISETTSLTLLNSARIACHKLADYFKEIDFTDVTDDGKPIYTAKDVAANLGAVGKIVDSLDALEEKVKKEQTSKSKIRGGGKVGPYED